MLDTLGLSAEAKAARRNSIGGSDANIIMSGNPERLIQLWREKRGEAEPEDLSNNLAVVMGSFTEPLNCAWFEKQTGLKVTRRGEVVTFDMGGLPLACTLDGIAEDAVFEAKHCGVRNTDAELFERYVGQLTHNCIVAGLRRAFLSCFKGNGDWMMMEYALDDDYAAALIEAERAFWACVQSGEPPAPLPPPPAPKPVGVREVDMSTSNAWTIWAADYLETEHHAVRHERAKREIKALVPDDASKCFGAGLVVNRTKAGALRFAKEGEAA